MTRTLDYDTLPPHSQLRREIVEGGLKITALPEEPGPLVRRAARIDAAFPAALICAIVLMLGFAVFGAAYESNRRFMPGVLSGVLLCAFIIFCAALFALIWRTQYALRIETAQNALKQMTILAASQGRLVVETQGPLGSMSHDLRDSIVDIQVLRSGSSQYLEIELKDGGHVELLEGRDEIELNWVMRALKSAIRISSIPAAE